MSVEYTPMMKVRDGAAAARKFELVGKSIWRPTLRLIEERFIKSNAELKCDLALADLARDLADAHEARRKQFAAIIRFVRHREARGPAKDMMEQIRRDEKLCKLLVEYEERSEIIGMMEFVCDLKTNPACGTSRRAVGAATP